ncbi:MAG: hypothetical protein K2K31_01690 [Clostridia bacterium]|nr:hypothetical protein [Clostridia bacterium]
METWLYIIVICIVFVGIISFFTIKNNKQKKRIEKYKNDRNVYGGDVNFQQLVTDTYTGEAVTVNDYENDADSSFEYFSLDEPQEEVDVNNIEEDEDDDNAFLDAKFAEYEKYLRENMNFDDDEEDNFENNDNVVGMPVVDDGLDDFDLDKIVEELDDGSAKTFPKSRNEIYKEYGFDINSLKGKTPEEIAEIVKGLPSNIQEMVLTDILSRKNFDDEED